MGPILEEASMPIGAQLHVAGTLECGPYGYVVRSGTGRTQIGYPRGARNMIGRRVEVEGCRVAFDEITCDRIWQHGEPRPTRRSLPRIDHMLIAVFVAYGFIASVASLMA
jgi:Protein of unknown function (DUF5818)